MLWAAASGQVTMYWDTNGTTAGAGGATPSGTWRTSGAANRNWSTSAAGTATTANWTNNRIANFSAGTDATGNYTVTLASGPDADSVVIQEGGTITFTSSNLTLTGTTPSITINSGSTGVFDTRLLGSNGLVKNGTGTIVLNNTGNNYSGATIVNAGTMQIGAGNNILPNTSALTVASGATFQLLPGGSTEVVASLSGGGSVAINDNTFKVGDANDTTFSGTISGAGTFLKQGTGNLTLSGNNSGLTGLFDFNTGVVIATSNNATGLNSTADFANNTALRLSGNITLNTAMTLRGDGSGFGVLRNLSGSNTINGDLNFATNTTITADAGTLTLTGAVTRGNSNFTADGAGNVTLSGAIEGGNFANVFKAGAGTLTLSGTNTYTGATTLTGGTLSVGTIGNGGVAGNLGAASTAASNFVFDGGTLRYTGATASTDRDFTINSGTTATIDVSSGGTNLTLAGATTGTTGGLTKTGAGTLTLSGSNLHTGATTLTGGTLSVGTIGNGGVAGNFGAASTAASNLVFNGGTLGYTGATASTDRNFTINSGTTATIDVSSGGTNLTLAGATTGTTGGLTKTGSGTLTLSGTNLHTGVTTLTGGTLSVGTIGNGGVSGNLGAASTAAGNLVFNGGILRYTGATASTNRNFTINSGTTATIDVASGSTNLTLSGATTNTTTADLNKVGSGTLTLSGTNLHSGVTTVSAGTLVASGNSSLGNTAGNVAVNSGATLSLAGGTNITRAGALTLNGTGTSGSIGALHAGGGSGTTSQWTGSTTINSASTITAADNLLIIGNGANGQFNSTTLTLNAGLTFHTPNAATVVPVYLPYPSYILDASNIMVNSLITGSGGITKTGDGTLSIIRGSSTGNSFTGDTVISGGKLIADGGTANGSNLSSTNIFIGNSGSANNDTVTLQMGQTASVSSNNILGIYNPTTNASSSNLTIYEDGLLKMNQGSNGFINLTLKGGHVDSGGNNTLLTLSGGLTSSASAQVSLIENGNLGIGSNKLTVNVASGTVPSGIDLQIDSKIQQGVGFTAVASGTSLEKTGTGKAVLTGDNTYGGVTDVLAGVLNVQHANALGQNGGSLGNTDHGTTVASGAQLQLQGGITIANETLTLNGTGVSSTGALRNLSGNNTLEGFVYLSGASRINSDSGTLAITNPGGVGGTILNGTAGPAKNLTFGGAGDVTVNGGIAGQIQNLTKDGSGTATLAGNNSYLGTTTVSSGALKITHNNGLAGTGVTVSGTGAALQFAQDAASSNISVVGVGATLLGTGISNGGAIQNLNGSNSYAGNVTLGANSRITANSGSTLTLSGSIAGSGYALSVGGAGNTVYNGAISGSGTSITKTDGGTVTLGGTSANTFTGAFNLNDGTVELNKTPGVAALGNVTVNLGDGIGAANSATLRLLQSAQIDNSAAIVLASDGRFDVNSTTATVGSIAGNGAILIGTGQLIAGGNNTSTTFSGTMSGSSSALFDKQGSGTLTINSNLGYGGTLKLTAGVLQIDVNNLFSGNVDILAGTTLRLSSDVTIGGTLHIKGNTTIDFAGAVSSLNAFNLIIDGGVTVTIINWVDGYDYFYAQNFLGASFDTTGATPMNQVVFNPPTWTGANTKWLSYDNQITPVPEPSTYGALLLALSGALLGYRRYRGPQRGMPTPR